MGISSNEISALKEILEKFHTSKISNKVKNAGSSNANVHNEDSWPTPGFQLSPKLRTVQGNIVKLLRDDILPR